MKTEDIIMLDCKKEGNRELINKFLWKVKPCAKILEKNHYTRTEIAPSAITRTLTPSDHVRTLSERPTYTADSAVARTVAANFQ